MTLMQSLVLGVVQGATEFLPISSSGHLVLVPWLLGWEFDPKAAFIFDVLVQWGTLAAVVVYFRKDLARLVSGAIHGIQKKSTWNEPDSRLFWLLLLASLPGTAAGILIKDLVAFSFDNPFFPCIFLLLTAALLFTAEKVRKKSRSLEEIQPSDAFWIGVFQILALFPGVSRSGSTISGSMLRGLGREAAARFSFLMSIPIMLGAGIIALIDLASYENIGILLPPLILGTAAASVIGYLSIRWLLNFISNNQFTVFAWYCLILGFGGLIFYAFTG